jgi:mitochondrial fission protein ELM1
LIATGRTSLVVSLAIRQASRERTFTVQIQNPVVSLERFGCVIVPSHDKIHGNNVISMTGALHRASPEMLRRESAKWAPRFAHLPRPSVAVLLGGTNSAYRLGIEEIEKLAGQLIALARNGQAGLLITASRRTGAANMAQLRNLLRDCASFIWEGNGDNPYYGMLGAADLFVVTCDSVNMISEACSTGKPVHVFQLPGGSPKFTFFFDTLLATQRIRPFTGSLEFWQYEPLREIDHVAALVRLAYDENRSNTNPPIG